MSQNNRIKSRFQFVFLLLILTLMIFSGIYYLRKDRGDRDLSIIKLVPQRGVLLDEVYGRGHVSSAVNVDITSPLDGNTTIVEILPEGVRVEKDEPIARLDTEKLENRINIHQFWLDETPGEIEQYKNDLEKYEFDLENYLMGTVKTKCMEIENDIIKKKEALRQSRINVKMSNQLLVLGYTTKAQLDIDEVACQKNENDLKESLLEKEIFLKYTSEKEITDIISSMDTTKTALDESSVWTEKIEKSLKKLLEQYESAVIRAPNSGRIVYANQLLRPGRNENEMIREGSTVKKGQLLFRIPDPSSMQIQALLTEENVFRTRPGMKASFIFDVQKNSSFDGEVIKVNQYPELDRHSPVKKYIVQIKINDIARILRAGIDLRTGFSVDVRIVVNEEKDRLMIPTHAIISSGEKDFCLFFNRGKWNYREILLGTISDRKAVVLEGLTEKDVIVAGAVKYKDKIALPAPSAPSRFREKKEILKKEQMKNKLLNEDIAKKHEKNRDDIKKDDSIAPIKDPSEAKEITVPDEINIIKKQYKKYAAVRKYFDFTTVEFCQKLDLNSDDKIGSDEIKKKMPELLPLIKDWDRNQNRSLEYTELAIGLYKARNICKKADSLSISMKENKGGKNE